MKIENIKCSVCGGLFSVEYNKDPSPNTTDNFYCVFCGCGIGDKDGKMIMMKYKCTGGE